MINNHFRQAITAKVYNNSKGSRKIICKAAAGRKTYLYE